jgi:hypothetical protein
MTYQKTGIVLMVAIASWTMPVHAAENEVIPESGAKVYVREHPQTGKPFVTLSAGQVARDPFPGFTRREIRPDYRMLEANSKGIAYDGPVSDRKKVYIFAATMITLGVAGGVVTAAIPASAAAGAGSGAGTGILAGGAVVANAVAADIVLESQIKPGEENYVHEGKTVSAAGDPKKISFRDALRAASANTSRSTRPVSDPMVINPGEQRLVV